MGRCKLTHEQQVEAIAKINPNIEVLGKIINDRTKVLCRCKICNHEWNPRPNDLKKGTGCPKCYGNAKLSQEDQVKAIRKKNPEVEILGKIANNSTKVLCRCNNCGHEWEVTPHDLKNGSGCPKCRKGVKLSHEEHVATILKKHPNIVVLEKIVNARTKVLCRCKTCGYEWNPAPKDLKQGQGCPRCAKYGFLSHDFGELYLMVDDPQEPTLMKIGVSVRTEKRRKKILRSLRKAGVGISDLHVVRVWKGLTKDLHKVEKAIHQFFAKYKVNFSTKFDGCNEIFIYKPEVFDVVEKMCSEIAKDLDTSRALAYTEHEE